MSTPFGRKNFVNGVELGNGLTGFKALFKANAAIAADQTITWLATLPGSTQALTIDAAGNISTAALGAGGSVSSVALSLPSIFAVSGSPIITTGTLAATLQNQSPNTFFAGPSSGGAATPAFRGIAFVDLSALVGTTANTLAAGNDSRLHAQNTDTGTTSPSFQLDSGNGGPRLKNSSGALQARNAADSGYADIVCQNLTVTGTTTTVNSETVTIADNIIQLNSDLTTGTPTQDLGIEGLRGSSSSASLKWVESSTEWRAGLLGSEIALSRRKTITFTNADLTSGIVILTHGLGVELPGFTLYDNNKEVASANTAKPNTAGTPTNEYRLDFSGWGTLSGTWTAVFVG